ncbi:hypothetical protein AWI92_14425 [Listeria monocytogenes]|nr:hypothetical protein AWI92_14425 [Listeria monocytogenes]
MTTCEAVVKGESVPEPGVPESFRVLSKERQGLGMEVKMLSADEEESEMRDMDDDDVTNKNDAFNIVHPESATAEKKE